MHAYSKFFMRASFECFGIIQICVKPCDTVSANMVLLLVSLQLSVGGLLVKGWFGFSKAKFLFRSWPSQGPYMCTAINKLQGSDVT